MSLLGIFFLKVFVALKGTSLVDRAIGLMEKLEMSHFLGTLFEWFVVW